MRAPRRQALIFSLLALAAGGATAQAGFARGAAAVVQAEGGRALASARSQGHGAAAAAALAARGRDAATVGTLVAAESRAGRNGVTHLRLEQQLDGLPVYGAYVKAAFNANGDLVHLIDHLASTAAGTAAAARVDEVAALRAAMARLHPTAAVEFRAAGQRGAAKQFDGGAFFHGKPEVSAVVVPMTDGTLQKGWLVQTWTKRGNQLHHTLVGADGSVLFVESRTANDSYKVFAVDPVKTQQTTVSGPGTGNAESPAGWLGSGAQTTVNIAGNNVKAYLDTDKNNRADRGGTTVTTGNFVATANLAQAPSTTTNREVAVQNLFYLNNRIHDILYQHGFDEAAGNFQSSNFGLGGAGGDPVLAEAQDGSGTDNANFATPADGQSPRMQMYLWNQPGTHEVVVSPGSPIYSASGAAYGPAFTAAGVTGAVATTTPANGCTSISTNLTGKIAVIDRGGCEFTLKTLNAQAKGATAVIVVNNNATRDYEVFSMAAGTNAKQVKIPSLMVSLSSGNDLKTRLASNMTARKKAIQPLMIDAALDSDIVYHEYCHGLTWRMIGGMSGPMAGAIGEGMGDACALLINATVSGTQDDVMGEYSASDPLGIRSYRYDGYPLTYADLTGAEVHADGELYAAIVWDLLKNQYGFARSGELFSALVNGMNYTPSSPRYETMRDGILAGLGAGHADTCKVWNAFTKFGVGVGASGAVFPPSESFVKGGGCP